MIANIKKLSMGFLSDGYQEPDSSPFLNFDKEGKYTFRIMSPEPIMGWEYWIDTVKKDGTKGSKPVRVKDGTPINPGELRINAKTGDVEKVKWFWGVVVYNFDAKRFQTLVLTQKTIRMAMEQTVKNPKWGNPIDYNFVVTRDDSSGKTNYYVSTEPKEPLDKAIVDQYNAMRVNLEVLYAGGDPLNPGNGEGSEDLSDGEIDELLSDNDSPNTPF